MTLILEETPATPVVGKAVETWNSAEEKFLGYLRELKTAGWWLRNGDKLPLRLLSPWSNGSSGPGFCPLTAIYCQRFGKFCNLTAWRDAANALGLPLALGEEIVAAADNRPSRMRQMMLDIFTD